MRHIKVNVKIKSCTLCKLAVSIIKVLKNNLYSVMIRLLKIKIVLKKLKNTANLDQKITQDTLIDAMFRAREN